jgi:putative SOS response-associated peptidase YedK
MSEVVPDYNIAPSTFQPVIRHSGDSGVRELLLMRWGQVPSSARRSIDFLGLTTCNVKG